MDFPLFQVIFPVQVEGNTCNLLFLFNSTLSYVFSNDSALIFSVILARMTNFSTERSKIILNLHLFQTCIDAYVSYYSNTPDNSETNWTLNLNLFK